MFNNKKYKEKIKNLETIIEKKDSIISKQLNELDKLKKELSALKEKTTQKTKPKKTSKVKKEV